MEERWWYFLIVLHNIYLTFSYHMLHSGSSISHPLIFLPFLKWSLLAFSSRTVHVCINQPPTSVSRHLQLRSGGFFGCKVLLPTCSCWQQPVHSDYGEDAGVLLNSVIYTVSASTVLWYSLGNITYDSQTFSLFKRHLKTNLFQTSRLPLV